MTDRCRPRGADRIRAVDAQLQGYAAGRLRRLHTDCPHGPGHERRAWIEGWLTAVAADKRQQPAESAFVSREAKRWGSLDLELLDQARSRGLPFDFIADLLDCSPRTARDKAAERGLTRRGRLPALACTKGAPHASAR